MQSHLTLVYTNQFVFDSLLHVLGDTDTCDTKFTAYRNSLKLNIIDLMVFSLHNRTTVHSYNQHFASSGLEWQAHTKLLTCMNQLFFHFSTRFSKNFSPILHTPLQFARRVHTIW